MTPGPLRGGSDEDLETLFSLYGGACLSLATRIVGDSHKAEDVVQEAFLDVWRHPERRDPGRASARSWLLMLTHRRAVDRVRMDQARRTVRLELLAVVLDDRPDVEQVVIDRLLAEPVRQAITQLSIKQRQVLVLAYWGGYTHVEIAMITGIPLGTVKTRLRAAVGRLRTLLPCQDG